MQMLLRPFKHYADFTGRDGRREFWLFAVIFVIANLAANYVDALDGERQIIAARMGAAELTVSILLFLPFIASGARRLHDSGRSGWWLMLIYLPYLGWVASDGNGRAELLFLGALALGFLVLLILLLLPGTAGLNRFGSRES